jgi:hydrogenase maturation protease
LQDSFKTAIVGAGNVLMGDDGIGVMAVRQIAGAISGPHVCGYETKYSHVGTIIPKPNSESIIAIEAGTDMDIVFDTLLRYGYVIILDAMVFGKAPATLYRIPFGKIMACNENTGLSLHERGPLAALKMAYLIGKKPSGFILGVEPEKICPGIGLSPSVARVIPRLINQTLNLNTTTSPSFIT